MPARAAFADRRLPEMLSRLRRFPKSEVSGTFFFVAIHIDACARLNSCHVNIRELAVVRKLRDAIVDRAFAGIGVGLFLQSLNELDHVVDMVGGADPVLRRLDAK